MHLLIVVDLSTDHVPPQSEDKLATNHTSCQLLTIQTDSDSTLQVKLNSPKAVSAPAWKSALIECRQIRNKYDIYSVYHQTNPQEKLIEKRNLIKFNISKEQVDDIYQRYTISAPTMTNRNNNTLVIGVAMDRYVMQQLTFHPHALCNPSILSTNETNSDTICVFSIMNKFPKLNCNYVTLKNFDSGELFKKAQEANLSTTPFILITLGKTAIMN